MNREEFDYRYWKDPSTRKYLLPDDKVGGSEEWFLTPNAHIVSSGAALVLAVTSRGGAGADDLVQATANLEI